MCKIEVTHICSLLLTDILDFGLMKCSVKVDDCSIKVL